MPSKRKKNEARKVKKEGRRESETAVTFKPKKFCEILLSIHARTSQANILHPDQKAAKCMTCKRLYGSKF